MRISRASDFALRILMLLAKSENALSVGEIADRLRLPKSHVMKIVAKLSSLGLAETQRGRGGGVALGVPAETIQVGGVVRAFEADFAVVDCLNKARADCVYLPKCALKPAMVAATNAFLECLDGYSLARIVKSTQAPRHG